MLIELLSSSNHVSFNIKVAQIIGLEPAIYLSQIIDINEKAVRKAKLDNNFFIVDRKYIESRTTLTKDKQISIEQDLINMGILQRHDTKKNCIMLHLTTLTSIMMSPDEELLKDISSLSRAKKRTKAQVIEDNLKSNVLTVNSELRNAYYEWIESVLEKEGALTKAAVVHAQTAIDQYSNRDLDVALKILEIASVNGYRDITWAINSYDKDKGSAARVAQTRATAQKNAEIAFTTRTRLGAEVF